MESRQSTELPRQTALSLWVLQQRVGWHSEQGGLEPRGGAGGGLGGRQTPEHTCSLCHLAPGGSTSLWPKTNTGLFQDLLQTASWTRKRLLSSALGRLWEERLRCRFMGNQAWGSRASSSGLVAKTSPDIHHQPRPPLLPVTPTSDNSLTGERLKSPFTYPGFTEGLQSILQRKNNVFTLTPLGRQKMRLPAPGLIMLCIAPKVCSEQAGSSDFSQTAQDAPAELTQSEEVSPDRRTTGQLQLCMSLHIEMAYQVSSQTKTAF